jgi:ABC-type antimicrobial peptide transport system permease subunit
MLMLEHTIILFLALLSAVVLGFGISIFARMVDEAMDYGNYLWRIRKNLALKYAKISDQRGVVKELLYDKLRSRVLTVTDIDYQDQPDFIQEVYNEIAAKEWMFTRWLCRKCMATYFAFWICVFMLPLGYFSIPFIFVLSIGTILATYYFTVKQIGD